ncbi:non-ribosomal peptide synthetase [Paenibacillus sp. UNC499MF]|uniref:non-ribosomal peptide synthetase n=1 Tax=Paenibacillus sp. UNC499MF TaxID=1502751 RepID=UPI00089F8DBC|nr:non-ribosomal peptide synthetase [Paenibacillus sp. UNC499MF]SEG74864.1 amino acid adenylation domain-containing protein [Paenibacillus sp. UNC499MF]
MKSLFEKEEAYWKQKFNAEDSLTFLPYNPPSEIMDRPDSEEKPDVVSLTLPPELSGRILRLANGSDLAVFMIVLAGVNCLLHIYARRENVLVGIPADTGNGEEPAIHDFLLIKTYINRDSTFKSLLGQVKPAIGEALENQQLPFRKMTEALNIEIAPEGIPVLNTIVTYKKIHKADIQGKAAADTVFEFDLSGDSIRMNVCFNGRRYDPGFIEKAAAHLVQLLSVLLFQPDLELGKADMLTPSEKHRLLAEFNDTETDYDRDQTIHGLIEEQAARVPDATAVVYEQEHLTYRELNERANRLARTLRAAGVQPDQLVGLMAGRSLEIAVGILAVLKAGGAYVPIDPEYPEERIRYLLEDSGAKLLLTQGRLLDRVPFEGTVLTLDDESSYSGDGTNLEPVNGPDHLAYVIYTSGTTGKPKGVMVEHHGLVSLKNMFRDTLGITETDRIVQFASLSFDASCWEVFKALFFGAALYIPTAETILDNRSFQRYMNDNGITAAILPPTYAAYLNPDHMPELQKLITGGSAVSAEFVQQWKDKVRYFNAYGPTEASIVTSVWTAGNGDNGLKPIPIGRPIQNHRIYILDDHLQLVPAGVEGELCIAGEGLARGYLNRPELTAEKFVENPFSPGERMYRTGDLARWLPDGNIEYRGRIDHQVKVRGYRIETGEIEERLLQVPSVQEAIVIAREEADGQQLCAYFVAQSKLTAGGLKEALAKVLPGYMIPAHFVQLVRMPLTPNGKIDRKALPAPEESAEEPAEYIAPRTLLEVKIAQIWKDVLGLRRISVKDNFFDLGGSSLSLMRLIQTIYDETGIEVPLNQQFKNLTVEAMALGSGESGLEIKGQSFIKLNKSGAMNVFCFPPGSGFGIGYRELANLLDDRFVLYGTDFIEDSESYEAMLDGYVDEIVRLQEEAPYVLLGYCFGGNLMFEVAQRMEKRGFRVSDLIMVDSWIKETLTPLETTDSEWQEILEDLSESEKELMANPVIRERVGSKVRATLMYEAQLINRGTVEGHIHELIAEDSDAFRLEHGLPSWRGAAAGIYTEYKLAGAHEKLLEPECLDGTAEVILRILEEIARRSGASTKVLHGS